jgi:hypothetical protein
MFRDKLGRKGQVLIRDDDDEVRIIPPSQLSWVGHTDRNDVREWNDAISLSWFSHMSWSILTQFLRKQHFLCVTVASDRKAKLSFRHSCAKNTELAFCETSDPAELSVQLRDAVGAFACLTMRFGFWIIPNVSVH